MEGPIIKWHTFSDATPQSFNVYRAVTGFIVAFPNSLRSGNKLIFSASNQTRQTITLSGSGIDTVLADINAQGKGIEAKKSINSTHLFIRCTARVNPKLKLFSCDFLSELGMAPRLIAPRSEFFLIASIPYTQGVATYTHPDPDGDFLDWYHVTTLQCGTESIPTTDQQPYVDPQTLCVTEGRVIDLQNNPIPGAEVRAKIMIPVGMQDNSGIIYEYKSTFTDKYGRWSLPLIQNQLVLFHIQSIGYNQVLQVPSSDFALFKDLIPVRDHEFEVDSQ